MKIRIAGLLVLLAILAVIFMRPVASQEEELSNLEDRIDNTVREYGTIESAHTLQITNEVAGEMTIRSVVPDGTKVEKGDLLVELDDSALKTQRSAAQSEVSAAEAARQQAEQQRNSAQQAAGELSNLHEIKVKVAQLNRETSLSKDGVFDVSLRNAKREADLAELSLKAISRRIEISKNALPTVAEDQQLLAIEMEKARGEAAKARDQIQLLTAWERPYQTALLELAVSQAKVDLAQKKYQSQTAILQAEATLSQATLELERAEAKLKRVKDQLAKCRITSPWDGIVIYEVQTRRSSNPDQLQAGAKIAEGQQLFTISDLTQFRIRATVHESRIHRVKKGQAVTIQMDSFPNRTFHGKVLSVNQTPEPSSFFSESVKAYAVRVSIDAPPDLLKIGLTGMVEIETK